MIKWETKIYDKKVKKSIVSFLCDKCRKSTWINIQKAKSKKYQFCNSCYQKSDEKKLVARKNSNNRRSYDGTDNPNYRGGLAEILCRCGIKFKIHPSCSSFRKFCSLPCKYKYSVSMSKYFKYKNIKMRSSWELEFAKYLDEKGYNWKYEPESFATTYGFYTPDFWVDELNTYFEIKGFFRDRSAKGKFEEFAKNHPVVLGDLKYLKSIGFERITSGPRKGQLCRQIQ